MIHNLIKFQIWKFYDKEFQYLYDLKINRKYLVTIQEDINTS